ncbi:MAG TPA: AraC family transcriptional regulator ligand-binding domain-containing protein, partial [Alphaproteobacteria bacterium]|nr:AraC family transcriptional regulator ligand-binding domain-containing protein [Alphaproteobacteria bacterium]
MGKMMNDDTTIEYSPIGHIHALLTKTSKLGVDPNAILRKCNLSFTLSDMESGKILSLNRPHFSTIVRACILAATDAFSRDNRQIMGRLDFDLMCYGCLQCGTLEEAIARTADFLHLLNDSQGCLELYREGGTAIVAFTMFPAEPDWELIFQLNAFAVFHRLLGWLIGEDLRDVEFYTEFDPSCRSQARLLSPYSELKFGCARHEMRFSADQLTRPIVRNHLDLAEFLKFFPFDCSLPREEKQSWADTVRAHYKTMLYRGQALPTTAALAGALGISSATLRRRLDDERSSIRGIKEQARMELALQYLDRSTLSIDELAAHLDFSSSKAF